MKDKLMKLLKQDIIRHIIIDSVLIVLGLLLCLLRGRALNLFMSIASMGLIAYGIVCIIRFCVTKIDRSLPSLFTEGAIWMIIGVVIDMFQASFLFGLILLFQGIKLIIYAVQLKYLREKNWYISFVYGIIISIVGGIGVILANTQIASNIVSIVIGVSFMVYGIFNIVMECAFKKTFGRIKSKQADKFSDNENSKDTDNFTDYTIS